MNVWRMFILSAFGEQPEIDTTKQVRRLISANAEVDKRNFHQRIAGKRSRVAQGGLAPSLLRAFAFEDRFPIKNGFFKEILLKMAVEMTNAQENNFQDEWSLDLGMLVSLWNVTYPSEPFIPAAKKSF